MYSRADDRSYSQMKKILGLKRGISRREIDKNIITRPQLSIDYNHALK